MSWLRGKPKNEVVIDMIDSELKTVNTLRDNLNTYFPNDKTNQRINTIKGILGRIAGEIPIIKEPN